MTSVFTPPKLTVAKLGKDPRPSVRNFEAQMHSFAGAVQIPGQRPDYFLGLVATNAFFAAHFNVNGIVPKRPEELELPTPLANNAPGAVVATFKFNTDAKACIDAAKAAFKNAGIEAASECDQVHKLARDPGSTSTIRISGKEFLQMVVDKFGKLRPK